MSHVAEIKLQIKDLAALEKACKQLGLELVRDQKTYRWFGRSVGDYPLPEGFTAQDLGKCDHAIRIPGDSRAYEIGVVKRKDGKPGYQLLWDFWAGGHGMTQKVGGNQAVKLQNEYAAAVAVKHYVSQGYRVQRQVKEDGRIVLTASR